MTRPVISIVIPARNEAEDIANTLEACLSMDGFTKDIIVVDDSNDDTPQIVQRYKNYGVRLIHREHNDNGCCGARNLGMQQAIGDIIVLFNADDLPKPDFLQRLLPHYENGADYVVVRSIVKNQDVIWGKYVAAIEEAYGSLDPEWSEGFSCRRKAVEQIGYIPGDFPIPFCRDYMLGVSLKKTGFKKHIDLTIPVEHMVPGTLATYWRNRVWRGSFAVPHAYYIRGIQPVWITVRELLKAGRNVVKYLFILPALWSGVKLTLKTTGKWRNLINMLYAMIITDFATTIGGIRCLKQLWRVTNQ